MENILVCDIGGTSSRFALFARDDGNDEIRLLSEIWEETNAFASFAQLLTAIREKDRRYDPAQYQRLVVAVPGPVTPDDLLYFPNVKWRIGKAALGRLYPGTTFSFINDFIAQAFGCLTGAAADALAVIEPATPVPAPSDLAIVGAGTGTGHGALKRVGEFFIPFPSEAGHVHFPFQTKDELKFKDFLHKKSGKISPVCNDIVSGQGLADLHHFLTGRELSPLAAALELTPECETTPWFARFYARICRNFAFTALASGGQLFVSGGVAIKNPFLVNNEFFRNEFLASSSNITLLHNIGVSLIRNEGIGLHGAAYYALKVR